MGQIVTVDFHDRQLVALERDGKVYVALRLIAGGLGLDWSTQLQRVKRDGILAEAVVMITEPQ